MTLGLASYPGRLRPVLDRVCVGVRVASRERVRVAYQRLGLTPRPGGLTLDQLRALPDGPRRRAIEAETNRLDELIYAVLPADERIELLAGLGRCPAEPIHRS